MKTAISLSEDTGSQEYFFGHGGITYDEKTKIVTFSDEASAELQKMIKVLQAELKEQEGVIVEPPTSTEITVAKVQDTADKMLTKKKSDKSISHFLQRAMAAIKGEKGKKNIQKVEEKIVKYAGKNDKAKHIYLRYSEEGVEKVINDDVPLIVWPNGDFEGIIGKYSTRLRGFGLSKKEKTPLTTGKEADPSTDIGKFVTGLVEPQGVKNKKNVNS